MGYVNKMVSLLALINCKHLLIPSIISTSSEEESKNSLHPTGRRGVGTCHLSGIGAPGVHATWLGKQLTTLHCIISPQPRGTFMDKLMLAISVVTSLDFPLCHFPEVITWIPGNSLVVWLQWEPHPQGMRGVGRS